MAKKLILNDLALNNRARTKINLIDNSITIVGKREFKLDTTKVNKRLLDVKKVKINASKKVRFNDRIEGAINQRIKDTDNALSNNEIFKQKYLEFKKLGYEKSFDDFIKIHVKNDGLNYRQLKRTSDFLNKVNNNKLNKVVKPLLEIPIKKSVDLKGFTIPKEIIKLPKEYKGQFIIKDIYKGTIFKGEYISDNLSEEIKNNTLVSDILINFKDSVKAKKLNQSSFLLDISLYDSDKVIYNTQIKHSI